MKRRYIPLWVIVIAIIYLINNPITFNSKTITDPIQQTAQDVYDEHHTEVEQSLEDGTWLKKIADIGDQIGDFIKRALDTIGAHSNSLTTPTEEVESPEASVDDVYVSQSSMLSEFLEYASEQQEDRNQASLLQEASLIRVIDGDTIVVCIEGQEKDVRLIGIDSPESVNPDESKNCEYGKYASEYTKELLKDVDVVYLQFDEKKEDLYGRVLAYVWLSNDVNTSKIGDVSEYMVNAIILENGYAKNKDYQPNCKYSTEFTGFCMAAALQQNGLWSYEDYIDL